MSGIIAEGKFYENVNLICRKCGHTVYTSPNPGYRYQCPECDEDLFTFETDENQEDVLPWVTIAVAEKEAICFPFLKDGKIRCFENQAEAEVYLLEEGADAAEIGAVFLFVELWDDGSSIVQHGDIIGGGAMSIEKALSEQFAKDLETLRSENQEVHEAVVRKHKELMQIHMSLVTEECPDCGSENTLKWNVVKNGYQVFCTVCGFPMMLCGECMCDSSFCDWDSDTFLCYRTVEGFWKNLTDIPFCEDKEGRLLIEKEYRLMLGTREIASFPAGTDREEIWHWFDEHYPRGVAYLLYGDDESMEPDVYFSIEDGNDIQIDKSFSMEGAIMMCKRNITAKEVFEFKKKDGEYELVGCVYNKHSGGMEDEDRTEKEE